MPIGPSESIIAELLRQKFARDQGPTGMERTTAQLMQVMQGVAQGIAIYDSMKAIPAKYGQDEIVPGTPGAPAIPGIIGSPAQAGQNVPSLVAGTMNTRGAAMDQLFPQTRMSASVPGIGPSMQVPPQPFQLPGIGPNYGTDNLISPATRTMPGVGPANQINAPAPRTAPNIFGALMPRPSAASSISDVPMVNVGGSPAVAPTPGIPAIPATPSTTRHIPGTMDFDKLKSAATVSSAFTGTGPKNLMAQTLKDTGFGALGNFDPALKQYFDVEGNPLFTVPKGGAVLPLQTTDVLSESDALKKGKVAKGTRIVDTSPPGGTTAAEKTQARFEDTLKAIEDDAMQFAQIDKIAAVNPAKFQARFRSKYTELLHERGDKQFTPGMIEDALETKFGAQDRALEGKVYAEKNPSQVLKLKERMTILRSSGVTDFTEQRKDLVSKGIPIALVDELIAEASK